VNHPDQFFEPGAFGVEYFAAETSEAVVAAPGIGSGRGSRFFDQLVLHEALQGAVEGSGPEAHFAASAFDDFLHDGIAVLVASREGEEYVEPVGLEGEEGLGCATVFHDPIYMLKYIYYAVAREVKGLVGAFRGGRATAGSALVGWL
jgi:hypothetical protein